LSFFALTQLELLVLSFYNTLSIILIVETIPSHA
jgi:hypothetical protein